MLEDKKPECNCFPCSPFYGAVFAEANVLKADCSLSHTTAGTLRPQEMSRGSIATVAGSTQYLSEDHHSSHNSVFGAPVKQQR